MASTCRHCGADLADDALRCASCGDPTPRANRRVVVVLVLIAVAGLLTGLITFLVLAA